MPYKKSKLLIEYVNFLRNQQCSSDATIVIRRKFVEPFLHYLGNVSQPSKLFKLTAKTIHDYIIVTAQPLHRASKKHLTSSIRSFLRFSYIKGYLKRNLLAAVPVITTRKLDRLPQSMSWKDTQKLLRMPDRKTHSGRRDFAVLSLLIYYGIRIGQVTTLKLQDIRWDEGIICFAASKNGNALQLPLYKKVASALLSYIKNDRKVSEYQEVFLTVKGMQRPLGKDNHYQTCIKKHFVKAGIISTSQGSRIIRHAFATRLVNQKVPMKIISDLLGHRWIETTFIYTKVDITRLRELALNWPEVA
jgi:integrase/recombinase XerD